MSAMIQICVFVAINYGIKRIIDYYEPAQLREKITRYEARKREADAYWHEYYP